MPCIFSSGEYKNYVRLKPVQEIENMRKATEIKEEPLYLIWRKEVTVAMYTCRIIKENKVCNLHLHRDDKYVPHAIVRNISAEYTDY